MDVDSSDRKIQKKVRRPPQPGSGHCPAARSPAAVEFWLRHAQQRAACGDLCAATCVLQCATASPQHFPTVFTQVREAQLSQYNYILVVGEAEQAEGTVNVSRVGLPTATAQQQVMGVPAYVRKL